MTRTSVPLPEDLPPAAFSVRTALRLGVSRERLRSADVERIGHGIYRHRGARTFEQDLAAAILADRPDAVVSHLSAARLLRLPLPDGLGPEGWHLGIPLDLSITPGSSPLQRADVRTHRIEVPESQRSDAEGLAVTSPGRTFLDLAAVLDEEALVILGDVLVRKDPAQRSGAPCCSPKALRQVVGAAQGRPVAHPARAALARVRIGSRSSETTMLRLRLEDARLPPPEVGRTVHGDDGQTLGSVDLSWPQWKVAARYVSGESVDPRRIQQEARASERLRRHGWIEVVLSGPDLEARGRWAVRRIGETLRERGWDGRRAPWRPSWRGW